MKPLNLEEVKHFITNQSDETKIYIGVDSERILKFYDGAEKWVNDYFLAIVVHIDGKHGCKVFGEVQTELDFDKRPSRPVIRLMNEVYKVADLYLKLSEVLSNRYVEVHLDINPEEKHVSNIILSQAVGYIKGVCNITPKVKPLAFAATCAADRIKTVLQ